MQRANNFLRHRQNDFKLVVLVVEVGGSEFVRDWGASSTLGDCALAQITPDSTLGTESSVVTPTNINGLPTEQIDGGATRGANLFHSFDEFSVPTGSAAYFNNALNIQNIISRVTGSFISNIDGLLRANASANLFLLNPNGIIFGPNASLNIGGSILGSTASSLNFADGRQFSATNSQAPPLLTVSVPIGLQYGGTAGSIVNQSRTFDSSSGRFGLQVQPGKTLALADGDVRMEGGYLIAPGGRVELGGVAFAGTVGLFVDGNNLSLSYPEVGQRADVSLTNGALVRVAAGGGGSIAINARNLNVLGGSRLFAGILPGQGSVDAQAGDITLNATGTITVAGSNSSFFSSIFNFVGWEAVGKGGDINIQAGSLSLTDGAQLFTYTFGQGDAGSISAKVDDSVSLANSFIASDVGSGAVGKGGNIDIQARSLSLTDGADLSASTNGRGDAGSVVLQTNDSVSLAGDGTSIFNTVESGAEGDSGGINITAGSLSLTNGAQLQTSVKKAAVDGTLPGGRGNAGNVNIDVSDAVTIAGSRSTVYTSVDGGAIGNGGDINIRSGSLSLTDGGTLFATTSGQGNAGSIVLQVNGAVSLANADNAGSLSSGNRAFLSTGTSGQGDGGDITIKAGSLSVTNGAFLNSATEGQGDSGDITIKAGSLSVTNGAFLNTSTFGQGDAGNVIIEADGTVSFDGAVEIDGSPIASSAYSFVGVLPDQGLLGIGAGGDIRIKAGSLSVTNGALLNTSTFGQGDAGNVIIEADGTVSFDGAVEIDGFLFYSAAVSGVGAIPASEISRFVGALPNQGIVGTGAGGDIRITAGSLSLSDGASLIASTVGQGDAGSVFVQTNDSVSLTNNSFITSTVESGAVGNGGNINITTESLFVTNGAELSASSQGNGAAGKIEVAASSILLDNKAAITATTTSGNGGDITLSAQDLLLLRRNSNISTTAGTEQAGGDGGNISIDTDNLVALENSDITANAFQGQGGRVEITAQGIFGTEARVQQTLETSDITASSNLGPKFSGTVEINTPDVDTSLGLATLPAELVEASRLIATGCSALGDNKFIVTGRGGLPPNPNDTLSSDTVWTDLRPTTKLAENRLLSEQATQPTNPTTEQLMEAQGWVINDKGEVVLTAQAPTVTLHVPWLPSSDCHAPDPSS